MAEDMQHRMIRYLNDIYASEIKSLRNIKTLIEESTDSDLRWTLYEHLLETQRQTERIGDRIFVIGGDKSVAQTIIDQIALNDSRFNSFYNDQNDLQTQALIKIASQEAFEIGSYTALQSYAIAVGDYETAKLAESILYEEQAAYEKLTKLIPQVAAYAAEGELVAV